MKRNAQTVLCRSLRGKDRHELSPLSELRMERRNRFGMPGMRRIWQHGARVGSNAETGRCCSTVRKKRMSVHWEGRQIEITAPLVSCDICAEERFQTPGMWGYTGPNPGSELSLIVCRKEDWNQYSIPLCSLSPTVSLDGIKLLALKAGWTITEVYGRQLWIGPICRATKSVPALAPEQNGAEQGIANPKK
jgi:hypothetical protein